MFFWLYEKCSKFVVAMADSAFGQTDGMGVPPPAYFASGKAEELFEQLAADSKYAAILLSNKKLDTLKEFLAAHPANNFINAVCGLVGVDAKGHAYRLSVVYVFGDTVRELLVWLGRYSKEFCGGKPLTRVNGVKDLDDTSKFLGFGFEDRGTPERDYYEVPVAHVLNMSNLGEQEEYVAQYRGFNNVAAVVNITGLGHVEQPRLQSSSKTWIKRKDDGDDGDDGNVLLFLWSMGLKDLMAGLKALNGELKKKLKGEELQQVESFTKLKRACFVVGGLKSLSTMELYRPVAKAAVPAAPAAQAAEPVAKAAVPAAPAAQAAEHVAKAAPVAAAQAAAAEPAAKAAPALFREQDFPCLQTEQGLADVMTPEETLKRFKQQMAIIKVKMPEFHGTLLSVLGIFSFRDVMDAVNEK